MDDQSTLHPASHAADKIADLWWILFVVSAIVCAVVTLLVLVGAAKGSRRRELDNPDPYAADPVFGKWLIVGAGVAVPAVVVTVLFALSVATLPAVSAPKASDARLTIAVVGRQWFWDVHYREGDVRTANELHIPVGEPVRVIATTQDVIHSFWVPELNRKVDMIPGRRNSVLLEADNPGRYRGQCAEFCGLQHANMALLVVAEPRAQFDAWLARARRPAAQPTSDEARRGQSVFLGSACGDCHRIAGTPADGTVGPDLTHVGSRVTLAAGTIPNTPGDLAAWIIDPQHVKPGNKMPATRLGGDDLGALMTYVESLK